MLDLDKKQYFTCVWEIVKVLTLFGDGGEMV